MPILKEFELDLDYIEDNAYISRLMRENGWEYYEATRFDYEKNWKEKRMKLRDEMRCIASLYENFFKKTKFKNDKCWKITVQGVKEIYNSDIKTVGEVTEVQVIFDISSYFQLEEYEKKKLILEALKKGIDLVVEKEQWDKNLFDQPYQEIINIDYINNYVWQSKTSPSRKFIAEVFCEHKINTFDISLNIKTRSGEEIKSVKVISERPNEWSFVSHLGSLKWISKEEVALINVKETKQWTVKF
ncbi:hypothetical protein JOC85_002469 [Bacillus mesophilus]|uniref:Uncharacterized protein n=1 Tax=Bacillus mesophilus TaxID=1808955 RepID=A0A6M0QBD5_9BACI|nr:hypothetical protein [Bacillus mesophilus]MBM7661666.1 hypothetical protein [Bacillus mesophilus]NEY72328.1 hypothetical protein [Bacillus mesophilus]